VNASDQRLWTQLAESVIGKFAGACLAAFTAARSGSRVIARAEAARNAWHSFTPAARWRLIGIMLIVAVATNLGLLSLQPPSGWWWWAVPAMVGGFGMAILALSIIAGRAGVKN
jgi:hypothetical protein